jgi:two-component system, chemotaxis family, protein-glutamate methylesterase/glutaminase
MTDKSPIRVLVVDDTALYRKVLSDILASVQGVEVVGTAYNGLAALDKIGSLKPDLLTLDIEMPDMNGIEVLEEIKARGLEAGVIVVSSLTREGSDLTLRALELGAFDFITKPQSGSIVENSDALRKALTLMIQGFARQREIRSVLRIGSSASKELPQPSKDVRGNISLKALRRNKAEIVAIGISTGGPNALARMMPSFPKNLAVPLLIVQHMPPLFTQSLAKSLDSRCAITVKEAEEGEPLVPGTALIAPGGRQMKIEAGHDGRTRVVKITDDPPVNSCRPSVDYLFNSVARHYVGRATGVIMTGMGSDGLEGLRLMRKNGAFIIAQDEASSVVYGMPKGPVDAGIVDVIAPLERMVEEILRTVR